MDGLLEGKVAIVTGGAGVIGRAICELFAEHGASLVVSDVIDPEAGDLARAICVAGGKAVAHLGDAATVEGANASVALALETYGKVDVLVCIAGLYPDLKKVQELTLGRVEQLLHTNIGGVYLPVRAAIPALRKTRGAIVAAGSEAALHGPVPGMSYGATKDWVSTFIRGVAMEQGPYGIRANVVAPGQVEPVTDSDSVLPLASVPLGRRGTPREVANVFLFLASDLAGYVTGSVYTVDGGAAAPGGNRESSIRPTTAPAPS